MFAALPLTAALLLSAPPPDDGTPPETVAGRTAEQWAADLSDANRVVRNRAVLSLRAFGPAAAPHLAAALKSDDQAVRFWATEGLGMVPETDAAREALPDFRTVAAEGGTAERLAAGFALAALGEPEVGLPPLLDGLDHPSRGMAVTAADFLARLGQTAAPAAEALKTAAYDHGDYHVRYRSAQAYAAVTGDELDSKQVQK